MGRRDLAALFARDLVVVTGKGGVGKSTVAAALGTAAAARGLRTIVAEVSARDDVSRALAGTGTGPFREQAIGEGLHHISIDPDWALEEYLVDQLPMRALATTLTSSRLFSYLAAATPGLPELVTMGKVWELAQHVRRTPGGEPYDLVILDAPATGHGIAILEAARTFIEVARVGPVARQGNRINDLVSDPAKTAVVVVATPEEMPVNETLSLRGSLADRLGLPLALAVVNGVLPDRLTAADARALEAASPGPATQTALSHHARSRAQRAQVARLRRGLDGTPVCTLPYLFRRALDAQDIAGLGRKLA